MLNCQNSLLFINDSPLAEYLRRTSNTIEPGGFQRINIIRNLDIQNNSQMELKFENRAKWATELSFEKMFLKIRFEK